MFSSPCGARRTLHNEQRLRNQRDDLLLEKCFLNLPIATAINPNMGRFPHLDVRKEQRWCERKRRRSKQRANNLLEESLCVRPALRTSLPPTAASRSSAPSGHSPVGARNERADKQPAAERLRSRARVAFRQCTGESPASALLGVHFSTSDAPQLVTKSSLWDSVLCMEQRRHNTRHAAALAAAAANSTDSFALSSPSHSSTPSPTRQKCPASPSDINSKTDMYDSFQTWALKTYGDSAKTKTVTRRKYNRIVKILKGEEQTNAENSKFRFWVKAKGFRVGPPSGHSASAKSSDQVLYIPCSKIPSHGSERTESVVYKKVAVVENFYDIIYGVHVEMDGRGGKHAGQKRTYKAIAEMYSFLPREAVTHFLMSCTDCQKRMHLGAEQQQRTPAGSHDNGHQLDESISSLDTTGGDETDSLHIDYSLPITTTYLKHMRSLGYSEEDALNPDREDSEDVESEVSEDPNTPATAGHMYDGIAKDETGVGSPVSQTTAGPSGRRRAVARYRKHDSPMQWSDSINEEPINMIKGDYSNNNHDHSYERVTSPCNGCVKREATSTPDNLSASTKDDDDEDDDDDSDKIDINKYDPERLKAFNMFVRLFVDENLDRMIPISRQPKDKIQAIIDSCARQFPEFGERARKRIRTYLKSCRRNKRTRESTSWEFGRNTQPHLTSALAEQILANACENESQNAKRMRLGLKPIAAEIERTRSETPRSPPHENILQSTLRHGKSQVSSLLNGTQSSPSYTSAYRLVPNATTNGHASPIPSVSNGPTDLSIKKSTSSQSPVKHSLNPSEVVAVKQLIAGYRESAAFLLRSADELEQLLLQQN